MERLRKPQLSCFPPESKVRPQRIKSRTATAAPDPEEPWQHAGEKIVHRKPHIIVMGDVKQERKRMEIEEEMQTKQRVRYKDIIEIS